MVGPREVVIGSEEGGRLTLRPGRLRPGSDREMNATLETAALTATVWFHELHTGDLALGGFDGLAVLFEFMAESWGGNRRGWEGERGWQSIDAEIDLSATSDALGHITLAVKFTGYVEPWSAAGLVNLDAGQLPDAARKIRAFVEGI